ncbi:hypothetical protein DPMN_029242 [Dreissena polymorpha]|uniref:Uncharacterized protein n=1 Tax=Dreissena polymorpha TaxID=45954 RepID=A0A9D4LXT2_DREPO|nr:hypothetical protein DPMN_029242 [Dreissena polymorpha]
MESVNIAHPEQMGLDLQATNVIPARPTDSVHLYESIPPSPIADISFSDFAEDTGIITINFLVG